MSGESTAKYILASSANIFISPLVAQDRSFIKTRNKTGPRTIPWGIPDVISVPSDISPFITTLCFLFDEKS